MWDGLAQLIQIIVVLALGLIGIEYQAPSNDEDAQPEARIEFLLQPASYNVDLTAPDCAADAVLKTGTPMLIAQNETVVS